MTPTTWLTGLCFGEGPRWHDGRLYLSDMHDHRVLAIDENAKTRNYRSGRTLAVRARLDAVW